MFWQGGDAACLGFPGWPYYRFSRYSRVARGVDGVGGGGVVQPGNSRPDQDLDDRLPDPEQLTERLRPV
jgi:hypothetical protein